MKRSDLQAILMRSPVGFAVMEGPRLVFTVANDRYLEMVGRTAIVGRSWVDVFPELVGTPTEDAVRRAYAGEKFAFEEIPVPLERAGTDAVGLFSFTLDPLAGGDDGIDGVVCVAADVTELVQRRREAESLAERLRHREERYRTLFESIDDGYCLVQMVVDEHDDVVDYLFLEANATFSGHTGIEAPVGRTIRQLVPDISTSWFELYGRVAATGEPARFENNDPALDRWFEVFASRVGDPTLRQVAIVFKDVSARKHAEMERERVHAAERAARREAEDANRVKDEFLATLSHELRTPLNAMLGWVTMLRSGAVAPERRERALETIERNARAQAQLVDDLLDTSRVLAGKLVLDLRPVDLAPIVAAAVDVVRPAARAKNIRMEVALDERERVVGDPQRLQQVFWNLLSNAAKFTPQGGRISVSIGRDELSTHVTVADSGVGIPPSFLPHVFERFRQADSSTTRSFGGLGLGLSIVRHLVELHGGRVDASSAGEGQGARFIVRLPSAPARDTAPVTAIRTVSTPVPDPFACPPAIRDLDVLLVHGDDAARGAIRVALEACGARTRVVHPAEAIDAFDTASPTVLVVDLESSGGSAVAFIQDVRARPRTSGGAVPAIALMRETDTAARARALATGFTVCIAQPIEPRELLAAIAALALLVRAAEP